MALLRTADIVRRSVSSVVAPAGVTLQQYNVLRILRGAPPGGLPTLEIGARLVERTPGTTRLLDRLVEKGFVDRSVGGDRRKVLCTITPRGLALLAALDDDVLHADELLETGGMSGTGLAHLIALLDGVRSALAGPGYRPHSGAAPAKIRRPREPRNAGRPPAPPRKEKP